MTRGTRRERVARRASIAGAVAAQHGGVARRADLLARGLSRGDLRSEVERGVWQTAGVHTLCVDGTEPRGEGLFWRALWECGPRSVLDGPSALLAAGLRHWEVDVIHVTVPRNASVRRVPGVRLHVLREVGPTTRAGLRRTRTDVATLRAAQWARTDREAATIVAMAVQQRLVAPELLLERWAAVKVTPRRAVLDAVIRDVCDGAHSINELDVAAACRARRLPVPSRQELRTGPWGRVYLDLWWEAESVHVEIQGAHHYQGLKVVDDTLRGNALAISHPDLISLQIPVLGWRVEPGRYLDQIEAALAEGRRRALARGA